MCSLCESGKKRVVHAAHDDMAAGAATLSPGTTAASLPQDYNSPGRRILIKGGVILSVDDAVGNFPKGDVLVADGKILAVAAEIHAPDAAVIDATGKVVMPGFIDTHHHQFETVLRSQLAHGILINDGLPVNATNYYETVLQKFSLGYTPEDVYINELYGGIAQLDAGVTTVMDVSQIHHSPEHSDAAIEGLRDAGRRAVFGYFEGWGDRARYPDDARRIRETHFSSDDQLLTMIMGGEIYLPGFEKAWEVGRDLGLPIALHVVGTFGMQPTFDQLGAEGWFKDDNIFIHMTGMSEDGWRYAADAGAHVSLSVPIEMHMRHGTPPIQRVLDRGMGLSLSSDVECTMSADMFTQMRGLITVQRMFVNASALDGVADYPALMQPMDAIRCATIGGAKGLKLDKVTGSLTPGKQADIILLDATALNVAPLNHVAGAVVTLMERTNVDTVMVGGKIKKWQGQLLGFDLNRLRSDIAASRDRVFAAAGIVPNLFS